ncbi:unnamed protein product [Lactuca virosa]|uniref:EF-hand domain-containing protein n=1 Tax=Lactuca virosa TaxID=75947 RepID=A0AAU9NYY9_9ASTR|nr:unnamed protein product [Lactuca virosa]
MSYGFGNTKLQIAFLNFRLMKENIELTSAAAAAAGIVIFMELKFVCLTSLRYFLISYMFVEWVILLHDCYALWARPMWRFISATQTATTLTVANQPQDTRKLCCHGNKKSLGVDMNIIMERLGMFWDHADDKRRIIASEEILDLFAEEEPSLDEVKEAFGVFDRNKDGYIDVKELQYALSEMGYLRISESDCRRMIDGYDVDKDSKISFREFLKLMEDCFR